jgi:hypothetical protein
MLFRFGLGMLLAACGSAPDNANSSMSSPAASTPTDSSTTSPAATPVRITIGDTVLTAHLFDSSTGHDLAAQLTLTLTFRDLNGVEKTAPLPRRLSVDGMPAGDDPEVGDIGYWAPDGDLVFYYGDVGLLDWHHAHRRIRWRHNGYRPTVRRPHCNGRARSLAKSAHFMPVAGEGPRQASAPRR